MTAMNQQVQEFQKAAVDAAFKFARVSVDSAERLIALNLEVTKACVDETGKHIKAISTVTDGQELTSVRNKITESSLGSAADYSRRAYEVVASAQAEVTRLMEKQVSDWQEGLAESFDKAVDLAPAGSQAAVAAFRSNLTAANAAFDGMTKAFKQAAHVNGSEEPAPRQTVKKATAASKKRK